MKYKKHSVCFFIIYAIIFFLSACSSDYASKVPSTVDLSTRNKNEKLNEVLMLYSANSTNIIDEYLISPDAVASDISTIKGFISFGKGL